MILEGPGVEAADTFLASKMTPVEDSVFMAHMMERLRRSLLQLYCHSTGQISHYARRGQTSVALE